MSAQPYGRGSTLELRDRLSARDLELAAQVGELRLLSGRQLEALYFHQDSHRTAAAAARNCRRVLARLVEHRVLVRLERRVGGVRAGSASYVYSLGPAAQQLLDEQRARRRRYEPSAAFVGHQLAVSQLVVELTIAQRQGRLEIIDVQGEPACWRALPALGHSVLRPDLFVALGTGEFEHRWFVELDRGTHHRPALLRKAQLYEGYYQSGIEQARYDVFPRVAWITPDAARAERLREAFGGGPFSDGLMIVTTTDQAIDVLAGSRS